nr:vegetative cell wall protein gp1-like isoform X1 [Vicugna pacos]
MATPSRLMRERKPRPPRGPEGPNLSQDQSAWPAPRAARRRPAGHLHLFPLGAPCRLAPHRQLLRSEGATEPDLKKPEDATGTVETAPWEPTDHTTPTSSAGAHGAYYTPAHAGPGAAPMWPDSAWPPAAAQEAQATPWAGGPQPFPGPACVACPACGPSSPSWAPAPVPPWCPVPPRPPPPAAPLGGMSVRHFAEEEGGESSSEEEGATEPKLNKPEDATGTVETAPWELTDHNTLTSSAGAHGAYYTPGKLVNVDGIPCSSVPRN